MRRITKKSLVTLVELPATQFGKLNGMICRDVYSIFNLPSRALHVLEAVLKNKGFSNVEIINPFYSGNGQLTRKHFERIYDSDVVGFSAITRTLLPSLELTEEYKKIKEDKGIIIFGGPGPSFMAKDLLKREYGPDIIVRGEGERTLEELMERLVDGESLESVRGISYRNGREIIENPNRELMNREDFNSMPHPDYTEAVKGGMHVSVIETSRGCPNCCDFCLVREMYGGKYRLKPIEWVLEEWGRVKNLGKAVFFIDDNIAGSESRTEELFSRAIERGLEFPRLAQVQITVKAANNSSLLKTLKKVGVDTLYIGIESTNDETLKQLNKPYTADENKRAVEEFHRQGFWVHGMLMPGGDGDTKESLREMLEWSKGILDSAQFFPPGPLIGTKFYERMKNEGRILTEDYYLYDGQHVLVRPKNFTPIEHQLIVNNMYKEFYSFRNSLSRLIRSPSKKMSLYILAYTSLYGIVREGLYDAQSRQHLEFLRSVS